MKIVSQRNEMFKGKKIFKEVKRSDDFSMFIDGVMPSMMAINAKADVPPSQCV